MTHPIAVLTGDLIASTALPRARLENAIQALAQAAQQISDWQGGASPRFTRSRGDGWQIYLVHPEMALRAALYLRAALRIGGKDLSTRVSIATGPATLPDAPDLNHAGGAAFVASGRGLDAMTGPVTMTHASGGALAAATCLADHISQSWTSAQARALLHMLPPTPPTRTEAAAQIGISRQAVDQALSGAGYAALTEALALIETAP